MRGIFSKPVRKKFIDSSKAKPTSFKGRKYKKI